jgi:hypothetical protein
MRVPCEVEQVELDGDHGPVDGVMVTCSRCEATAEAFGTHEGSIRRCFVQLRDQCDEENFYYADEEP